MSVQLRKNRIRPATIDEWAHALRPGGHVELNPYPFALGLGGPALLNRDDRLTEVRHRT